MNSTEILDAVNARLLEKWPERTVYINVCPEDYERPSFWLEVTRDDRTPVTQRMTKRNVQIRLPRLPLSYFSIVNTLPYYKAERPLCRYLSHGK